MILLSDCRRKNNLKYRRNRLVRTIIKVEHAGKLLGSPTSIALAMVATEGRGNSCPYANNAKCIAIVGSYNRLIGNPYAAEQSGGDVAKITTWHANHHIISLSQLFN